MLYQQDLIKDCKLQQAAQIAERVFRAAHTNTPRSHLNIMNGSASLRSVSRTQHGSGIPVTRSMVTSPKLAQKIPRGGATKQVTEIPVNTKAAVVSKDKAEGVTPRSGERNPLLFRKTGILPPRGSSEASERRNVTRSAFSSPQTRRKEAPRSKDTLDVNRKSLPLDVFRDLRKNGNSRDGNPRVGSNANVEPWEHSSNVKQAGEATAFPVKGRSTSRYSNENLLLRSPGRKEQKTMTQGTRASCGWGSFSDEEMGTPEDLPSKPVSPTPLCPPGGATVRLPTGTQLSRTIMATVAPFRLQINPENDVSSLEDFSDCSSDSMELCCQDLGGMLGAHLKSRDCKATPSQEDHTKAYSKPEGKGVSMAAKRGKPVPQQGGPRAELRVFRAGSTEARLPVSSNLRKQKSLTNLSFLTDTEKKMHLYEPKWCDDMGKPSSGHLKGGLRPKEGSGQPPLSRNLSKSEHSLFQSKLAPSLAGGSPKPFSPLAAPSNLGKPSRIPRGPYAEVKPISKAPEAAEDSKSDDEILSAKAKANNKKQAPPGGPTGDDNKPYLKVDPELVVSRLDLIEGLEPDDADLKSGYMSDSDLLGKCMQEDEDDDLTNGTSISSTSAAPYLQPY
ncbi:UNVERIFIED_CONTAM: hypothetical protein FKN15_015091 [Acipenser sinensis]